MIYRFKRQSRRYEGYEKKRKESAIIKQTLPKEEKS